MEIVLSSGEIVAQLPACRVAGRLDRRAHSRSQAGCLLAAQSRKAMPRLNRVFAIIRAKSDRLCLQIVGGADEAHGPALRAHQYGMRGCLRALPFHAA